MAGKAVHRKPLRDAVLAEVEELPEKLRESSLATTALTLAELLPGCSPRDAVTLARELRQTMAELRQVADNVPDEEVDPVDELADRRAARRASAVPELAGGGVVGGRGRDRPGGQRRARPGRSSAVGASGGAD